MITIVQLEAEKWLKCSCCGEQIRTCEKYLQVQNNGRNVRGERYCMGCEDYAYENNPNACGAPDDNGERMLRSMEDYAAYRAAGCTDAYWED